MGYNFQNGIDELLKNIERSKQVDIIDRLKLQVSPPNSESTVATRQETSKEIER